MIDSIRAGLIVLLSLLPAALGSSFDGCVAKRSAEEAQRDPTWGSTRMDFFWKSVARTLAREASRRRAETLAALAVDIKPLKPPPEIPELNEADASDMETQGTYGKLPEVRVDVGTGAIFPLPLQEPTRFSWFQAALRGGHALRAVRKLERARAKWLTLPDDQKTGKFDRIAELLGSTAAELAQLGREIRYLELWIPQHLRVWKNARTTGELPLAYRVVQTKSRDEQTLATLRETLRPRRVLARAFLPEKLDQAPGGVVFIPVATDITDRKFLAEMEGAIATHWNQSPWARQNEVSFHIRWSPVGRDPEFADGRTTLEEHLARFPQDKAILTTGGLTVHVRDRAMILGPGRVTPRTLAHEFGHLIGFDDCYLRTLSSQGIYGLALLEWDNPYYPDDLMCDNSVGVARAEVW